VDISEKAKRKFKEWKLLLQAVQAEIKAESKLRWRTLL
jgi:hypothetical protein